MNLWMGRDAVVQSGRWYTMTAWHDSVQNKLNIQLDNGMVPSLNYSSGAMDATQAISLGAFADAASMVQLHAVTGASTQAYTCPQGEVCDYDQAHPPSVPPNAPGSGWAIVWMGAFRGRVDANDNQTTRTISGVTLTLAYDAEGHMVSVTGP